MKAIKEGMDRLEPDTKERAQCNKITSLLYSHCVLNTLGWCELMVLAVALCIRIDCTVRVNR